MCSIIWHDAVFKAFQHHNQFFPPCHFIHFKHPFIIKPFDDGHKCELCHHQRVVKHIVVLHNTSPRTTYVTFCYPVSGYILLHDPFWRPCHSQGESIRIELIMLFYCCIWATIKDFISFARGTRRRPDASDKRDEMIMPSNDKPVERIFCVSLYTLIVSQKPENVKYFTINFSKFAKDVTISKFNVTI